MSTAFDDVKPWPKAPPAAGSVAGHNRPPLDVEARAAFDDEINQRDGFRQRMIDLLGASERAIVTDDDSLARCGELVRQINAAAKVVDATHVTTKAPYLAAGRAVDAAKTELLGPLTAAKTRVEGKQTVYQRKQKAIRQAEARRAQEAEQARRREEAEREAAAGRDARGGGDTLDAVAAHYRQVEPERQIVRHELGAAVSTKREWLAQVEDYEVAFIAVANNVKVREAIDTAVKAMVRGGVHEIPGVRIWSDVKVSNR